MALPPDSRMRAPTWDASTISLATTPDWEATMERDCERSCADAAEAETAIANAAAMTGLSMRYPVNFTRRRIAMAEGSFYSGSGGNAHNPTLPLREG